MGYLSLNFSFTSTGIGEDNLMVEFVYTIWRKNRSTLSLRKKSVTINPEAVYVSFHQIENGKIFLDVLVEI